MTHLVTHPHTSLRNEICNITGLNHQGTTFISLKFPPMSSSLKSSNVTLTFNVSDDVKEHVEKSRFPNRRNVSGQTWKMSKWTLFHPFKPENNSNEIRIKTEIKMRIKRNKIKTVMWPILLSLALWGVIKRAQTPSSSYLAPPTLHFLNIQIY